MKYFLDTEFAETAGSIKLISLGLVSEDDRLLYLEASDFNPNDANPWVKDNVLPNLWKDYSINLWGSLKIDGGPMPTSQMGQVVRDWIVGKPEFWGYYADYDWVVFCWLFGAMINLPQGWPMYCRDIKQLADELGNPPLRQSSHHHALEDAEVAAANYRFLMKEKDERQTRLLEAARTWRGHPDRWS